MRNEGYLKASKSSAADEVLTPRYAVEPIVKYLKANKYKNILCPFDKQESQYVRVLEREGFNVQFGHLESDVDFFECSKEWIESQGIDCIVSNPPFSKKDQILSHLYALQIPFMMLLPIQALQSIKRVNLYKENGLELLVFDKRIGFYTKGELQAVKTKNHFGSAYFCKGVLPRDLVFENLRIVQEKYNEVIG